MHLHSLGNLDNGGEAMDSYSDDLAVAIAWNMALKCHAEDKRHRHAMPDQYADKLLVLLESRLREKGLTYGHLGVTTDESDYAQAKSRIIPRGWNGEPLAPEPIGRGQNPRGHPLSLRALRSMFEEATRLGVVPEDEGNWAIQQLDISQKGYLMVAHMMGKIARGSLKGRGEQVLFAWRRPDVPDKPRIYEIDRQRTLGFGWRLPGLVAGKTARIGRQVEGLPAVLKLPSRRLAAWVFSDAQFRNERFEVLVQIGVFNLDVKPESVIDYVFASQVK